LFTLEVRRAIFDKWSTTRAGLTLLRAIHLITRHTSLNEKNIPLQA